MKSREALILVIVLTSSPLLLFLAFSFMTDVPFLSWVMCALWFYYRAIVHSNRKWMMAGSVASACAMGTRQFGVALIAGLIGAWLADKNRWQRKWLYMTGLLVPSTVAVWQLYQMILRPSFTQQVRVVEQKMYFQQSLLTVLVESAYRLGTILQYAALFLLPLIPVFLLMMRNFWKKEEPRCSVIFLGWILFVAGTVFYGFRTAEVAYGQLVRDGWIPSIPWLVASFVSGNARIPVTIISCIAAVILGWLLSMTVLRISYWRSLSEGEVLIHFSVLILCGLHLLYVQLNDTYMISVLPGILLILSPRFPEWTKTLRRLVFALSLCMLFLASIWTRGVLEREEALWQAAVRLHEKGVPESSIGGNMAWSTYHGAFDDWLEAQTPGKSVQDFAGPYRLHGPYYEFLEIQDRNKPFLIQDSSNEMCKSQPTILRIPYRNYLLRPSCIYVSSSH